MADTTENIVIQVSDGIASSINPKLDQMQQAALQAMDAFSRMQLAINKIDGGTISKLSGQIQANNSQFDAATRRVTAFGTASDATAKKVDRLTQSLSSQLPVIVSIGNALNTLQGAYSAAGGASQAFAAVQGQSNAAVNSGIGSMRIASTELSVLEGRLMGSNRAAASFLINVLKLGPAMESAFVVFGAIALVGVLAQMVGAVHKLIEAFQNLSGAETDARLRAIDYGDVLEKIKPDKFTFDSFARLSLGADANKNVTVTNVANANQILRQTMQLAEAQNRVNEAGLKGSALDAQKAKDQKAMNVLLDEAAAKNDGIAKTIKDQLTASKTIVLNDGNDNNGTGPRYTSVRNITDQNQIDKLTQQYKAATEAARNFRTEAQIATLNAQADSKKGDVAGEGEAAKAARQAAAAERKRQEEMIHARQAELDAVEALQGKSEEDEIKYWSTILILSEQGGKAYQDSLNNYNRALAKLQTNTNRENSKFDDRTETGALAKAGNELLTEQNAVHLKIVEDETKETSNLIKALNGEQEALIKNRDTLAEYNISSQEANGTITAQAAAHQMAALHTKQYEDAIAALMVQLKNYQEMPGLSDADRAAGVAKTTGQIDTLNTNRQQQYGVDKNATAGYSVGNVFGGNANSAPGNVMSQIQAMSEPLKETQKAFTDFFGTMTSGFADSFGKAIVYSKNLGTALRDVARQGISELISSLIKLGIQWAAAAAISATLGTASTTAASAQAAGAAAAWAPAATFASIATLGGADAVGGASLAATLAASMGLASGASAIGNASKFAEGGLITGPGTGTSDSIAAMVSSGEYITRATATTNNLPILQAINSGVNFAPMKGGSTAPNIRVTHDGSTNIQVTQGPTHGEVAIMARQISQQTVSEHAPAVIAADLNNPNSKTSKALNNNTYSTRRR